MAERNRGYKDMCFYQIWLRSFMDGNGDGIGDLAGVMQRLDYLQSLHVDGLCLSSLQPSPNADWGSDVTDYLDVSPDYGDMAAFRALLDEVHRRGMKLILEIFLDHTSDEHPWFQSSKRGEEPYKSYYYWRTAAEGKKYPNNWESLYGGAAWSWDEERGAYYLHIFSEHQPDLNLRNPAVRTELKRILRFWLEAGVDGFRLSTMTLLSKPRGLPDGMALLPLPRGMERYNRGPSVHALLQELRHDVLDRYECILVGDALLMGAEQALEYVREDRGDVDLLLAHETLNGDRLFTDELPHPFFLPKQKLLWAKWQSVLEKKGWNLLCMESADYARVISRYGSEKYRSESGKVLAASLLFQRGTPFLYQGQEIGMTNIRLDSIRWYEDVSTIGRYQSRRFLSEEKRLKRTWRSSRESARTPMQWSDSPHAGFSETEPWFYVNQNYRAVNVAQQERDPSSLLQFYRRALALRKALPVVRYGSYRDLAPLSRRVHVYERASRGVRLLVICSYSDRELSFRAPRGYDLREGRLLLHSETDAQLRGNGCTLRPYECRVYLFSTKEIELPEGLGEEEKHDLSEFYAPPCPTPEEGAAENGSEAAESGEAAKPDEGTESGETAKPGEGTESGAAAKPGEGTESGETAKPGEGTKSGEAAKPDGSAAEPERVEAAAEPPRRVRKPLPKGETRLVTSEGFFGSPSSARLRPPQEESGEQQSAGQGRGETPRGIFNNLGDKAIHEMPEEEDPPLPSSAPGRRPPRPQRERGLDNAGGEDFDWEGLFGSEGKE